MVPWEIFAVCHATQPRVSEQDIHTVLFPCTMTSTKKRTAAPSSKTRSSSSKEISLKKVKGESFYRNAKQVARAKMLTGGKAVRDKDGTIIKAAAFQKGESETKPGRVQPDRRWFGAYSST